MHPRRLFAHRGAAAERPENTMPAFERAIELGVDAIETDVHLTRDDRLIIAHDPSAFRTTGASFAWADIDLAQAQRLDAGWGFVAPDGSRPFAGRGIATPAFEELLDAFPDVVINVDMKTPRTLEPMLALLRERRAEDRVTLASFHTQTMVRVRRGGFGGETSLSQHEILSLLSLPAVLWRQLPLTGTAAQVPINVGPLRFDREPFIAKCHTLGLRVDFWTIDDVAEAERLLSLGADGIMTNDPAAMRPLFHAQA